MLNTIIFLSVVASIGVISASICSPALPLMADYFSKDFSDLQLVISLFLAGNAIGQLLSGPFSDYFNQKSIMFTGLVLFTISSLIAATADSMFILYGARFFQGMGTAAGPVLARAIASKVFSENKSAQIISFGALGVGGASMLSIMFSGMISHISWRGCFWITSFLGIILLLWAFFALRNDLLPEVKERDSLKNKFRAMITIFYQPQFLVNTAIHSLTYGLMYGYIGSFPFLLKGLFEEINPKYVGIYSAYMILIYILATSIGALLVPRLTASRLVILGVSLQLLSGLILALFCSVPGFFLGIALFNFSLGIILPMTTAAALSPVASKGTASSALGLCYRLSGSFISYLISLMPLAGGFNLGIASFAASLISLFGLIPLTFVAYFQNAKKAYTPSTFISK